MKTAHFYRAYYAMPCSTSYKLTELTRAWARHRM